MCNAWPGSLVQPPLVESRKDGLTTSTGPWSVSGSDSGTGVSGSTETSRMGITYDVVPCMLGESPNAAVARVYGVDDINEHLADEGLPPVAVLEHPPQAFDDWRTLIPRDIPSRPTSGWRSGFRSTASTSLWRNSAVTASP